MVGFSRPRISHASNCLRVLWCGRFETVQHIQRKKPGSSRKVLNYDTLQCGNCGNFMFVFWSAGEHSHGSGAMHGYHVLPWHWSTTTYPKHWPDDVGRYWVEARRSIEAKNWTAAALMARSAIQLVARSHGAKGSILKQEIDDLADKGLILRIMKDWSHEVRELANEGTHPQPGSTGTNEKDAKNVVEFLTFLMRVMHELPKQIEDFRKRKT
jgi:Domain of unknown function (DUF4145)